MIGEPKPDFTFRLLSGTIGKVAATVVTGALAYAAVEYGPTVVKTAYEGVTHSPAAQNMLKGTVGVVVLGVAAYACKQNHRDSIARLQRFWEGGESLQNPKSYLPKPKKTDHTTWQ